MGLRQQLFRVARSRYGVFGGIQKNAIAANSKYAGQLMRDHHHGGAQAVIQLQDQVI